MNIEEIVKTILEMIENTGMSPEGAIRRIGDKVLGDSSVALNERSDLKAFSLSAKRELLGLLDGGAPVTAILKGVAEVLGDPGAFGKFTERMGNISDTSVDFGETRASDTLNLSDEEKKTLRKHGMNPERIAAMSDDATIEDWRDLKAEEGK